MFIQPCFIRKNTSYLRKKLEELGYTYNGRDTESWGANALYCFDGKYYEVYPAKPSRYHLIVDCGVNEDIFLAIAALRDDTDKNQWFICIKDLETAFESFYVGDFILCKIDKFPKSEEGYFRKATVEEIIEHFTDK